MSKASLPLTYFVKMLFSFIFHLFLLVCISYYGNIRISEFEYLNIPKFYQSMKEISIIVLGEAVIAVTNEGRAKKSYYQTSTGFIQTTPDNGQGSSYLFTLSRECRDGSVIKYICCSYRGSRLDSQHPFQAAYNHLQLQFQKIQYPLFSLWASADSPLQLSMRSPQNNIYLYL